MLILDPSEVGLFSMAMIPIGFAMLFRDMGVSALIITAEDNDESIIESAFWLSTIVGVAITIILIIIGVFSRELFDNSDVEKIIYILSLSFLIGCFGIVYQSIMEKQSSFQDLAYIEILSVIIGSILAIYGAVNGWGVFALVLQQVASSSLNTIMLFWISNVKGFSFPEIKNLKSIIKFTKYFTGFSIINYIIRNIDNFLIARYCGVESLGLYSFAYKLMLFPIQMISGTTTRVLLPKLASYQNNDIEIRKIFLSSIQYISLIGFPILIILMVYISPIFIRTFGEKWKDSQDIIYILSAVGIMQIIIFPVGILYLIKKKSDLMMKVATIVGALTTIGFFIGIKWGIYGVAISYLITVFITMPLEFKIPGKLFNISIYQVLVKIRSPIISTIFSIFFVYLIDNHIDDNNLILNQLIYSILFIIFYITSEIINNKNLISKLIYQLKIKQ